MNQQANEQQRPGRVRWTRQLSRMSGLWTVPVDRGPCQAFGPCGPCHWTVPVDRARL
jgi:hypothetical protein